MHQQLELTFHRPKGGRRHLNQAPDRLVLNVNRLVGNVLFGCYVLLNCRSRLQVREPSAVEPVKVLVLLILVLVGRLGR